MFWDGVSHVFDWATHGAQTGRESHSYNPPPHSPGIPLVICSLVLIVNSEAYGGNLYSGAQPGLQTLDNSDNL